MNSSLPRGVSLALLVLTFLAFAPSDVAAQWSFWSPGTPCASGAVPRLDGIGPMSPSSTNVLTLIDAPAFDTCFLVVGFTSLRAPFGGGTLGPSPDLLIVITTDGAGGWSAPFVWPSVPAGTMLWYQVWCPQPSLAPPWCSSNTLKSTSS